MVSVALLHFPCVDKNNKEIATAITNLDIHDIARVCLTYGIEKFYIVHPYRSQRDLAQRIIDHWIKGFGGDYNPLRKQALQVIRLAESLEEARGENKTFTIATSAGYHKGALSWDSVRELAREKDMLLMFGTGWGLSPKVIEKADGVLEPIKTDITYNHLSVRAAMAIAIDRILGR